MTPSTQTKRTRLPVALALGTSLALAGCGGSERQVFAHYEGGAPRSAAREVQQEDGVWVRSGPFRSWHENGQLLAEGEYLSDERSGLWSFWREDGSLEERGSYLFGEKEGVWVARGADGTLDEDASGLFEAGQRVEALVFDGELETSYSNGTPHRFETLVDGVRHGPATTWYPNGAKESEGEYDHGRKTGAWTYYALDGSVDAQRSGEYDGITRIGP